MSAEELQALWAYAEEDGRQQPISLSPPNYTFYSTLHPMGTTELPAPSPAPEESPRRKCASHHKLKPKYHVTKWSSFVVPRERRKLTPLLPFVAAPSPYVYPSGPGYQGSLLVNHAASP